MSSNIIDFHKCEDDCKRPECLEKKITEITNKLNELTLINLKLVQLLGESTHYRVRRIV